MPGLCGLRSFREVAIRGLRLSLAIRQLQRAGAAVVTSQADLRAAAGQTQLRAGLIHIQLDLVGAQIVRQTSTHITPTTGHIHFSVNNKLVAMNYSAQQDTPLTPGLYRLTAEFVAADHVPFNPRVMTSIIVDVQ